MLLGAGAPDSDQATHASPPPSAASLRPLVLVLDLDACRFAEDLAKPPIPVQEALLLRGSLAPHKSWAQLSQVVDALHLAGEDERVQGLVAIIGEGETPTDLHRLLKQDKVPTVGTKFLVMWRGLSNKQVLDVFNSFPQTVEAAASMGLIDSVKPKIDAVRNITHHTCGQAAAAAQQNSPGVSYQDDVAGRQTSDVAGRQTSEQSTASHLVLPASDIMLAGVERFQKGMIDVTTVNDDTSSTEACIYLPFHAYMIAMDVQKTRQPKDTASKPGVALICITGEIASGSSASVPGKIDSHQICEDLRSAAEAEHVQAVVLRIDTPGGLALASHEIWDEVMQVKASGKPVIASMGNMAASAGCEIAAAADRIVAQPGTITGSIGVIDGKLNLAPALKQFGIDVETVSVGKNALMESWYTGVTRQQQRWADSILDRFYKDFVDKVAAGRNMRAEEVARVAKGRIWTGRDAYQVGLVDELGGLTKAIALAKQMARLPQDNGAVNVLEWTSTQQSLSSAPFASAVTVPSGPLATSRTKSQTGTEALTLLLA
ncbi:TPA: hypothetical protein ACH3X3_014917 [Trebouxia sp. C0006]